MDILSSLYESAYGTAPDVVEPITGSASNRMYFRISSPAGCCIGVNGLDKDENNAFITLAGHFRSKGINVPEIIAVSDDGMSYLQEDLGNDVLFDHRDDQDLLCRTMAMLPKIQFEAADGLDFSVCYPQPSFDRRMVMFDLNYFKYCFLKPSGLEFNEVLLQEDFEKLSDRLLKDETETFLYRDFNARNVMVRDGEPYFIDFQGGRKGPIYYDVASFIWHARAGYTDVLKERMLESYLEALSVYVDIPRIKFDAELKLFVLFRMLQVLGAYGFRGWQEGKAAFVVSIGPAIRALKELLPLLPEGYPYLYETLGRLVDLPRFKAEEVSDGCLVVKVCSFSYKKGLPHDDSGNGGGYLFDCRYIHNPGRYEPYKKLTGRDKEVIHFLEEDGEVFRFMDNVYGLVDPHVETYRRRGFTSLTVGFGCTGGQHRSVYCAEHLAAHLTERFPDVRVVLTHREHPSLNENQERR